MTTPIKLGYLVTSLRVGGAERQILALAAGLPRDRFRPEIVSTSGPGPLDGQAASAGIPVRYIGSGSLSGEPLPVRAIGRLGKTLAYIAEARRRHFDIVDAWLYPEDVLAALTRFATRTPIVLTGRRDVLPRGAGRLSRVVGDAAIRRFSDIVVANSAAVAAHAVRSHGVPPEKVRTIRNGVDVIPPLTADERRTARGTLGATDGDFLIGCVANYRAVKGHALLIEAFSKLSPRRPHLRLVLVGEGPLRPDLERCVRAAGLGAQVRLHGPVLDARPLYGAFDLVVQASSSEGLPNVLLEAAAAGRPIVATAAGGSSEIVIDGQTGLLVPVDDLDQLARALERVIDDGELRERLGAAARAHITVAFGMDRFVSEWAALYDALWAAKRRQRRTG